MTALTANRDTRELLGLNPVAKFVVYAAEIMYAGGIAAIDYTDEVQMAADTAGLKVVGRVKQYVDNTNDGLYAEVERGIFRFSNSATYPLARSSIGQVCYIEDDNIVAGFSTNLVSAGIVADVDSVGVWVDMRPEALAAAWERRPIARVAKTDDYTCTAAIAMEGRTWFDCSKSSLMTITLPSAVAGMRVGVRRMTASAGYDVSVQAGTGDKVQGSDAMSAASKKIDNTTDAVSEILWLRAQDDTCWVYDLPGAADFTSWVKNDA